MIGLISRRNYLIIAVGVAIVLFLVGTFLGQQIASGVDALPNSVSPDMSGLARAIIEPIKFVMLNPIVGGIIAGLFWPVVLLWIVLILLLLVLSSAQQLQPTVPGG